MLKQYPLTVSFHDMKYIFHLFLFPVSPFYRKEDGATQFNRIGQRTTLSFTFPRKWVSNLFTYLSVVGKGGHHALDEGKLNFRSNLSCWFFIFLWGCLNFWVIITNKENTLCWPFFDQFGPTMMFCHQLKGYVFHLIISESLDFSCVISCNSVSKDVVPKFMLFFY